MIRRRNFITLLGGAAAWPLAARAQQDGRVRRIGLLMPGDENDPLRKTYVSVLTQALSDLGWTDGRNVRMDLPWAGDDSNRIRALAQELVGLRPDIILTGGAPTTAALQRETRTIPIVFANAGDPVASGIVARLNRPGGNITGFAGSEPSLGGKWLELLSEIAPGLKRAAIMYNPDTTPASAYMSSLEAAALSFKIVANTAPVHSDEEIETAIMALGREPQGGLVVMPDIFTTAHRAPIILVVARNNVPAVYSDSVFARDGGLLSYGVHQLDNYRRAASYVDRILRGEKPGDLPVQLPTKFEMVVNRKTATALGLAIPPSILLRPPDPPARCADWSPAAVCTGCGGATWSGQMSGHLTSNTEHLALDRPAFSRCSYPVPAGRLCVSQVARKARRPAPAGPGSGSGSWDRTIRPVLSCLDSAPMGDNTNHPHRVHDRPRSRRNRLCSQGQPAGRQSNRCKLSVRHLLRQGN
jgi:putative ABC transport system substrate-binding protein